ncbi:MAG: thiamine phosphate synthase [Balneolaceae bacterium]
MKHRIKGVYLITDTSIQNRFSHVGLAHKTVPVGLDMIQLRDKEMSAGPLLDIAGDIARICRETDCLFIVNDRVDIALASGADGVHLGQNDFPIRQARERLGPGKIIGGTASTLEEARSVEEAGADYIGFGHIFETGTKVKNYPPRGLDGLRRVAEAVSLPITAIGGIHEENMQEVIRAGASAVAVSSVICKAEDPGEVVRRMRMKLDRFS